VARLQRIARRLVIIVAALAVLSTVLSFIYNAMTQGTVPLTAGRGHFVRTGDVRTHYETWGTSGSAVVLVHGFAESTFVWHVFGPRLAALGHRVYAIDVRGFGYTERRAPFTLAADTTQLARFMAAMHLDADHDSRPVLVGHSSGAAIIGNVARLHPKTVAGVVFVDGDGTPYGTGPRWGGTFVRDPWMRTVVRVVTRHPWVVRPFYRPLCGSTCPKWTAAEAAGWATPFRVKGAEDALEAVIHQGLIGLTPKQIEAIHVPAGVVRGDSDPQMGRRSAEITGRRLHTSRVTTIRHAGHLVMLAQPDALASTVEADIRSFSAPSQ